MGLILNPWLFGEQLGYQQKLSYLTRPAHSKVSAWVEKLTNVNTETGVQILTNVEVKGY